MNGAFDFVIADEVHAFITDVLRPIGTHSSNDSG
jgi:superfamily II DNA or RNA helicase